MERITLEEQITKCEQVLNKYKEAKKMLASARSWDFADIVGGKFIASIFKHNSLDKFNAVLKEANEMLIGLNALTKEGVKKPVLLEIDESAKTLDIYCDNLISDFRVSDSIQKCNIKLNDMIYQLEDLMIQLKQQYSEYFPELENGFGKLEEQEVVCPKCKFIHSLELMQCPNCGCIYSDDCQPIFKI